MTGRRISAWLSPNPVASISVPAHLLSLGSKVSMWLTPPHMKRKMTDLALGWSGESMRASLISPAWAHMPPRAAPKNPPAAWWRKLRREIRPQGKMELPDINELIQIEEEPGELFEARGIVLQIAERVVFFDGRRWAREGDAVSESDGVFA